MEPSLDDLQAPDFVSYVNGKLKGGKLQPDDQDFEPPESLSISEAECYRQACARKLIRMWKEWKSAQN